MLVRKHDTIVDEETGLVVVEQMDNRLRFHCHGRRFDCSLAPRNGAWEMQITDLQKNDRVVGVSTIDGDLNIFVPTSIFRDWVGVIRSWIFTQHDPFTPEVPKPN